MLNNCLNYSNRTLAYESSSSIFVDVVGCLYGIGDIESVGSKMEEEGYPHSYWLVSHSSHFKLFYFVISLP